MVTMILALLRVRFCGDTTYNLSSLHWNISLSFCSFSYNGGQLKLSVSDFINSQKGFNGDSKLKNIFVNVCVWYEGTKCKSKNVICSKWVCSLILSKRAMKNEQMVDIEQARNEKWIKENIFLSTKRTQNKIKIAQWRLLFILKEMCQTSFALI